MGFLVRSTPYIQEGFDWERAPHPSCFLSCHAETITVHPTAFSSAIPLSVELVEQRVNPWLPLTHAEPTFSHAAQQEVAARGRRVVL